MYLGEHVGVRLVLILALTAGLTVAGSAPPLAAQTAGETWTVLTADRSAAGELNMPYGLVVDQQGVLTVAEANGHRLQRLSPHW